MATHSSILAWEVPWTEEPGWRATVHGIAKVRHDLATKQTGWVREEPFVGLLSIKKVLSPNQHYY